MANLGFQMTGSGATDCAGGCGEIVMTSDLSEPAYCGDGECVNEDDECADCGESLDDHCEDCGECECTCDDYDENEE